jgi:hypothetical protein
VPGGLLGVVTDGWRALQRRRRPPLTAVATAAADEAPPEEELAVLETLAEDSTVGRSS